MEKDSLRNMLYVLSRFGLYIALCLFSWIMGSTILSGILGTIGSFIPKILDDIGITVAEFDIENSTGLFSFIAWLLTSIPLIAVFADDAKRHTAYRRYNTILVAFTAIISSVVFYMPAVISNYLEDNKAIKFIEMMYYSCQWLKPISENVEIYAMACSLLNVIICIVSYIVARRIYLRKFESGEYEYEE